MTATSVARPRFDSGRASRATAVTVAVLGTIVGLAGAEHGVGEILQGWTTPDGIVIRSWPDSGAFEIVDGEPALTLIPNLLVAGIVTVAVSIAVIAWSARWMHRDGNGWTLLGLSALLLVVGGGFGPPLMGFVIGTAAVKASQPAPQRQRSWDRLLARVWPLLLAAATLGYLSLVPGTVLLSHFVGVENPGLVFGLAGFSFSALVLTLIAARAADRAGRRVRPSILDHGNGARSRDLLRQRLARSATMGEAGVRRGSMGTADEELPGDNSGDRSRGGGRRTQRRRHGHAAAPSRHR